MKYLYIKYEEKEEKILQEAISNKTSETWKRSIEFEMYVYFLIIFSTLMD